MNPLRRAMGLALLLAALLLARAADLDAQCISESLFIPSATPSDSGATLLRAADLDGDSDQDLVVVHGAAARIVTWIRSASGLTQGLAYDWRSPIGGLAIADLDSDGDQDFAFTDDSSRVVFYRGTAAGAFELASTLAMNIQVHDILVADFDRLNGPDLVVSSPTGRVTSLISGPMPFAYAKVPTLTAPHASIALGQFDGDALPDLAVVRSGVPWIQIFKGYASDGRFAFLSTQTMPERVTSLRIADADADGRSDLVYGTASGAGYRRGQGTGAFDATGPFVALSSGNVRALAVGDVNRDGKPDVLCCLAASESVAVLVGGSSATLTHHSSYTVGFGPTDITEAPSAARGPRDFVVAVNGEPILSALVGNCSSPPPPGPPIPYPPYPDPGPAPNVAPWPVGGIPLCVVAGDQSGLVGVDDFAHGAYFAWRDWRNGESDIYALRIGPDGRPAPGWPEDGVAICTAPGEQSDVKCVSGEPEGVFVTWLDNRSGTPTLFFQGLNADGSVAEGWPVNGRSVCGLGQQWTTWAYPDRMGGLLLGWREIRANVHWFGAQHLNSEGSPASGWGSCGLETEFIYTRYDCGGSSQYSLWTVSPGWPDGFLITTRYQGFRCICLENCYDWDTSSISRVSPAGYGYNSAQTSAGDFRVSPDFAGGSFWTLPWGTERHDWQGTHLWTRSSSSGLDFTSIVSDGVGGFLLGGGAGVVRLLGDGYPPPEWTAAGVPVCDPPCVRGPLTIVPDGSGGMFVVWPDGRAGGSPAPTDLYATWLHADGTRGLGWQPSGRPIATLPVNEELAAVIPDRRGSAIVAWRDARNGDPNLYAYRLTTDLPVPALASLVSAASTPDGVDLEWFVPEGAAASVSVERRDDVSAWRELAALHPDGSSRVRYHDAQVSAGTRYAYRIVVNGRPLAETWIEVPFSMQFAFEGARPNPALHALQVTFALDRRSSVTISAFDVNGRRVSLKDLSELPAGRHVVSLTAPGALDPGIYWLELNAGGRRLRQKAVLVR